MGEEGHRGGNRDIMEGRRGHCGGKLGFWGKQGEPHRGRRHLEGRKALWGILERRGSIEREEEGHCNYKGVMG